MAEFHPDLERIARFVPHSLVNATSSKLMRAANGLMRAHQTPGVTITELTSPARLRVYRPDTAKSPGAALLWIHGGGMVIGSAKQDDRIAGMLARELGIVVASVDYRLAPQHPYPAAIDDCYAGLQWLHDQPDIDPSRIAVGGASAGGGLAASLAQVAHDRGELAIAFQLLVYPMLDDRSAIRPGVDGRNFRLWTQKSNRFGWQAYLGQPPGTDGVIAPAAPARRESLAGLPPAWVGVGSLDLFHTEDVEYAERLHAAGVPCALTVVPGAFHGFDIVAIKKPVAKEFHAEWIAALRDSLSLAAPRAT